MSGGMTEDAVRATRFELVDRHGNVRAVLACDGDSGAPTLSMRDTQGQTRVTVGLAWNDMPSIQLGADDGTARVALVARPEGNGLILVVDDAGNQRTLSPTD